MGSGMGGMGGMGNNMGPGMMGAGMGNNMGGPSKALVPGGGMAGNMAGNMGSANQMYPNGYAQGAMGQNMFPNQTGVPFNPNANVNPVQTQAKG